MTSLAAHASQATDGPHCPLETAALIIEVLLPVLVELATGWVAAALSMPMPETLPRVAFGDATTMRVILAALDGDPAAAASSGAKMLSMHDTRSKTNFLPLGWTGQSTAEVSILVYESVHHFQSLSAERFARPAAREKHSQDVQGRWLEGHRSRRILR